MWQWVKQHFLILLIGHKAGSFITIVSSSAKCFQTREIMDNIYWLSKMVTYTGTSLVIQWLRLPVQGAQWFDPWLGTEESTCWGSMVTCSIYQNRFGPYIEKFFSFTTLCVLGHISHVQLFILCPHWL